MLDTNTILDRLALHLPTFAPIFKRLLARRELSASARSGGPTSRGARPGVPAGLDLSSRRARLAVLDGKATVPRVSTLVEIVLPRAAMAGDRIADPEGVTDELARVFAGLKHDRVWATLMVGGSDVLVRRLTLPKGSKAETVRQLPSHAQLRLPGVDAEQMTYDMDVVEAPAGGSSMTVLAVAAKKEAVRVQQQVALDAGLHVAAVDVDAFALTNLWQYCYPQHAASRAMLFDLGLDSSLVVVADHGACALSRHSDYGLSSLVEALTVGGMLSPEEAERALLSGASPYALSPDGFGEWVRRLALELRRTTASHASTKGEPVTLFLSGYAGMIDGLADRLSEALEAPVRIFDPLEHLALDDSVAVGRPHEGACYALALGLALRLVV